ncbi:MAG: sel1 repeat family protein, partial [Acidobacteria bacterium]|nr:sel1 repeat family protein [Acidobacteriota bacterium]
WYRRAAEQHHPRAQSYLGVMLKNGLGVPQNDREAVKWFRRARGA